MVTREQKQRFYQWFNTLVQSYASDDEFIQKNISLKEYHTLRVCKEILYIGRKLHFNQSELLLAESMALFHDVGRFEQFKRFQSFDDRTTVNHAQLSVDMIIRDNILSSLSPEDQKEIIKAVLHHNQHHLPSGSDHEWIYAKLLRDADKLDIYRVVTTYYQEKQTNPNAALDFGLPHKSEYSKKILEDLLNNHTTNWEYVTTSTDMILLQIGWIFDINYLPTFQRLKQKQYVYTLIELLGDAELKHQIRDHVQQYFKKRLSEYDQS